MYVAFELDTTHIPRARNFCLENKFSGQSRDTAHAMLWADSLLPVPLPTGRQVTTWPHPNIFFRTVLYQLITLLQLPRVMDVTSQTLANSRNQLSLHEIL